jgi:hypothetical protein
VDECKPLHHGWWEQFAMQQVYKHNKHGEMTHVKIVNERYRLNAFTVKAEYRFGPVSFIAVHERVSPFIKPQSTHMVSINMTLNANPKP